MKKQRLLELDAIRGLAAFGVVLFHYFYRYNELYTHENLSTDWAYYGHYGVQLFFMVSGFVIFWTLTRIKKPLDFIVSRFSRLYPTYWCAALTTYLVVYFFGLPGREVSAQSALMNVLMFQAYLGVPNIDGVYWTLIVELTFYFLIFLFYIAGRLKDVEIILTLLVVVSILDAFDVLHIPKIIHILLILHHIPFFLAGISFYQLVNDIGSRKMHFIAISTALLSTIATQSIDKFIIFLGFYCFFYLAVSGKLRVLTTKPLVFLGSISYSLYLLHQNIGYVIINKSYSLGITPMAGVTLAILTSVILAAIFVKYIEIPSLRYIRESYKKSSQ